MFCTRSLHILRIGLRSIAGHRLRSALTTLGIVLGVTSVIVMLAVGEAARFEAIQQIQEMGATNIIVRSVRPLEDNKQDQADGQLSYGLTMQDVDRIRATVPTVVSVTPVRDFRKELRHLDRKLEGRVVAVMPNFQAMNGLQLSRGRFISDLDNERFANVAVLAAETAEMLFPLDDPIGRSIHIGENHSYTVVGVTQRRAPSGGLGGRVPAQDYNRDVYIPFATDQVRFGPVLTYQRAGTWQAEKLAISQITVTVDSTGHVKQTAEIIGGLLAQFHHQRDSALTVPLDLLEKVQETQRIFTLVLGAIASIALLVGGIGIMNIMLATVTERTREIGIRRAVGARQRDILWQFLAESMVLSSLGGMAGVCLGIALSYLVSYFFGLQTIIRAWSPMLALLVSVSVGLMFGTYPACRAARLEPIEALRYD